MTLFWKWHIHCFIGFYYYSNVQTVDENNKNDISNSQYIKPQVFIKISFNWPQLFLLCKNDRYLGGWVGSKPTYLCACLFHVATQTNMILAKTILLIQTFLYFITHVFNIYTPKCKTDHYWSLQMQNWLTNWQCLVNKRKHTDIKISISDIICISRLKNFSYMKRV